MQAFQPIWHFHSKGPHFCKGDDRLELCVPASSQTPGRVGDLDGTRNYACGTCGTSGSGFLPSGRLWCASRFFILSLYPLCLATVYAFCSDIGHWSWLHLWGLWCFLSDGFMRFHEVLENYVGWDWRDGAQVSFTGTMTRCDTCSVKACQCQAGKIGTSLWSFKDTWTNVIVVANEEPIRDILVPKVYH